MGTYNFAKDLSVAKKTESDVAMLLVSKGAELVSTCKTKEYDLLVKIKGTEFKFEIKEDMMCAASGNVALEYESRGKPSGISVSQADFYIYKIHTAEGVKYLAFKTSSLKKAIESKLYFRNVSGGDKGSNTKNYLFKYPVFEKLGKVIWEAPIPNAIDTGENGSILTK